MFSKGSVSGALASAIGTLLLTVSAGASASRLDQVANTPDHQESTAAVSAQSGVRMYLVQLQKAPAASAFAAAMRGVDRSDAVALARAGTLTRQRVAQIEADQATLRSGIRAIAPDASELYSTSKALNGIVLMATADAAARMRALPGVRSVQYLEPEVPTLGSSVPFVGAPAVWDAVDGLDATGAGVSIGIIDTGVDYQHPAFGGTGLLAEYQANDRTVAEASGPAQFPTARVVGGWDFVGDAYNGSTVATPSPDADPMDCLGHGMHVASTAAGSGVNLDGSAYTGPFDATTDYAALRIGPGVAPEADVYALRVFGCGGSTGFTAQAIEWSMDPNDDGDLSDHLDVINMSLGSNFGSVNAATAIASDNAAAAGVVVVASAGNAGDTFTISGSPGSSTRTITVANVSDAGLGGVSLVVNAPASLAGPKIAANNAFTANFPPLPSGQTGNVVPVQASAPVPPATAIQGCTAYANATAVSGNFALVQRGNCDFAVKAGHARDAGAIGVIVFNNVPGDPAPPGMGGAPAAPVPIPVVATSTAVGEAIVASVGGGTPVNVTLQAIAAGDVINASSSRGPRLDDLAPKPDISAPGTSITAAQTGVTCTGAMGSTGCLVANGSGYIAGGAPLTISGTSMAAPHVAGAAALLLELAPTRSVEEIKAALMNGALHDVTLGAGGAGGRISTSRAGSGRLDALESAALEVTAFNADQSGGVSIGFDGGVQGASTQTRQLRLVNHGQQAATVDLAFDYILDGPGVGFALPDGNEVTVPAGGSVVVPVQMVGDSAQMAHPRDPTMAPTQAVTGNLAALGALPRHWISEESAVLVLSQDGNAVGRVPVYAAPRPHGAVTVPATIDTAGAASGTSPLAMGGIGLCSGTVTAGACNNGEFDALSIVSAFELQAISPRNTAENPWNDIRYVGVANDGTRYNFGVGMYGRAQSAYGNTYQVEIDGNADGTAEFIIANGDPHTLSQRLFGTANIFGQDSNVILRFNTATNAIGSLGLFQLFDPRVIDTRVHGADLGFLSATPVQLGLGVGAAFNYRVTSCFAGFPMCTVVQPLAISDQTDWLRWNPSAPGVSTNLFFADAQPGNTLQATWNAANLATNNSLGLLLLQHQNGDGMTQQVVTFANTGNGAADAAADVAVTLAVDDAQPDIGQVVTFTATVTNNGPESPVAVAAAFQLPEGLDFVSDDAAGAYDDETGVWTLPAQATGSTATLQLQARVTRSGPIGVDFDAMGDVPDPDLVDNHAELDLSAASTSDIGAEVAVAAPSIVAGDNAIFTVTVSNAGPDTAYNVNVASALGGTPAIGNGTASAGVYDSASGNWNIGSLAVGASETLQLSYTLSVSGTFTFQSTATIADNDPTVPNEDSVDVTVTAAAASALTLVTGDNQVVPVGAVFPTPLAVRLVDAFGNGVPGVDVTFAAPAAGAGGSFGGSATVATNANGIATAPAFTANGVVGAYQVTATAGSFVQAFSLENTLAAAAVELSADDTTPTVDTDVLFTATVTGDAPFALTGTVDFIDDAANVLCDDVPVVDGEATCTASFDTMGAVSVSAVYSGDARFDADSDTLDIVVGEAPGPAIFADGFED